MICEHVTLQVYRTIKGGKHYTVAQSEDAAWASLRHFWAYKPEEKEAWSIQVKTERVFVVDGICRNWGTPEEPRPHVSWDCPACGQIHDTDLEKAELNPALWFCELGVDNAVFLVRWANGIE